MNFTQAVGSVFRNYVTFRGRACRSEYWWFALFSIIAGIVIGLIEVSLGWGSGSMTSGDGGFSASFGGGPLSLIWSLALFLPSLAVLVRRLHDTDRSGWWFWIMLIPLIGLIILIVFLATRGTAGDNRFGADPLA